MYLGYYGDRIGNSAKSTAQSYDWYQSKFGGSAQILAAALDAALAASARTDEASPSQTQPSTLLDTCDSCKKPLILMAQVHAPRSLCPTPSPPTGLAAIAANSVLNPNYKPPQGEDDEELRVLLILCCNEERCWKTGRATYASLLPSLSCRVCSSLKIHYLLFIYTLNRWRVYRYQPFVAVVEEELAHAPTDKSAAYLERVKKIDKEEADEQARKNKIATEKPVKNVFATSTAWGGGFGKPFGSSFGASPSSSAASSSAPQPTTSKPDLEELLRLRDVSIAPKKEISTKSNDSSDPQPATDSEASLSQNKDEDSTKKESAKARASKTQASEDTAFSFEEAYIEFDKEPELLDEASTYGHMKNKANESLSEGEDGTWAGEAYESGVEAKDKPFHRFQKRLKRSPEQCIRYWRGATPLYSSAEKLKPIPACEHCGGPRIAELQLTPPLLFYLKPRPSKSPVHIDFGTVIIYTCSANCTTSTKSLYKEHSILQKGA